MYLQDKVSYHINYDQKNNRQKFVVLENYFNHI